jgi:YidC/Oxa1 family membrane protein insertase
MSEQRNLFLAIVLSMVVVFGWQYFVVAPTIDEQQARDAAIGEQQAADPQTGMPTLPRETLPRDQALRQTQRIPIETATVDGSINRTGARLDDLRLREYRETPDPDSPEIELLSPLDVEFPYFVDVGWFATQGANYDIPGLESQWTATGGRLTPDSPVVLIYRGRDGLQFERQIAIDDRYVFTITDKVENMSGAPVILYPYARIMRPKIPEVQSYWVVHEGFIGVANDVLQDPSYDDVADGARVENFESTGGWAGITDKYWMTAIIPAQDAEVNGEFSVSDYNGGSAYETRYEFEPRTIAPGSTQEITHHVFAGPKVSQLIEDYRTELDIPLFDYAIDWGWFFFLTKPIFVAIDYIYRFVGNFGVAILIFTVFVKLLFFPLANTSYRAMSKMKKLQPEMERMREEFGEDKEKLQRAMLELYQKEKVNPAAGCLPILVQIPVFFSLYKVLFVTIEMRHAPFFGWIRDLSVAEPTSVFNLFGLLPFTPPDFLMLGVFPLLMGISMAIQMQLNPPPPDPVQQRVFAFMPWVFMFLMARFPSGLVIYWTWNNILSIAQQTYIMRQAGTPIHLFEKIGKKKDAKQANKPSDGRSD